MFIICICFKSPFNGLDEIVWNFSAWVLLKKNSAEKGRLKYDQRKLSMSCEPTLEGSERILKEPSGSKLTNSTQAKGKVLKNVSNLFIKRSILPVSKRTIGNAILE